MPELRIKKSISITKKIWRNYLIYIISFLFWKRTFAKIYIAVTITFGLISLSGYVFLFNLFAYLVVFYFGYLFLLSLKLLMYYFRVIALYKLPENNFDDFLFSFDEKGIRYDFGTKKMEFDWSHYHYFVDRGEVIYLLNKQRRILEIISTDLIDQENFNLIKELIIKKTIPFKKFI